MLRLKVETIEELFTPIPLNLATNLDLIWKRVVTCWLPNRALFICMIMRFWCHHSQFLSSGKPFGGRRKMISESFHTVSGTWDARFLTKIFTEINTRAYSSPEPFSRLTKLSLKIAYALLFTRFSPVFSYIFMYFLCLQCEANPLSGACVVLNVSLAKSPFYLTTLGSTRRSVSDKKKEDCFSWPNLTAFLSTEQRKRGLVTDVCS